MPYIKKIEEHILDTIDSEDSFLNKITSININDLSEGQLYNHTKDIKISNDKIEQLKTVQKFLKKHNDFFIFKIVKIYTPEIAKKLGIKPKDLIKVKEKDLKLYHL